MGIFFLFVSNVEYIGLLVVLIALISDAQIQTIRRNWGIAGTLLLLFTLMSYDIKNANIQLALYIVLIIIMIKLLLLKRNKNLFLSVVLAALLISISSQLLRNMVSVGVAGLNLQISSQSEKLLARLILWVFVIVVYLYIVNNYPAELKNIPLKYMIIFMVVLMADCISITFFGEYILDDIRLEHGWIAEVAYILMSLGVFVQLGLLIAIYFSRNTYRTQQALATKYLEEQVAHYQYLSEREQNTRRFRHDFKSHMAMAKQLYEEGKREEFEAYFHKMTEQIAAIGNRVTVNNDIADAIINRYYDEAALAGITMEVEGHFPGECYVSAYDLCTVLSNLLSNAIDAEKEAGGKTIYCGVRYDETQILIVVKNDYVNPIKRTDNRFVSTKGDLRHQGFGIANINEVVRKNNGHIFYDTADARFVVRLSLCNMKQNS